MATRYWIGGEGIWTDTTNWSTSSGGSGGASVPTSSDAVIFDANSGSSFGMNTVDITASVGCATLTCTRATYGSAITFTFGTNGFLHVYGNASINGVAFYSTDPINRGVSFHPGASSNSTVSIGSGIVLPYAVFNAMDGGSAYTVNIQSNVSAYVLDLWGGAVNTNGYTLEAQYRTYCGNSSGYSINLGSSTIYTPYFWTTANCNLTASSATIDMNYSNYYHIQQDSTPTFYGGGKTFGTINFYSGLGGFVIYDSFTVGNLNCNSLASTTVTGWEYNLFQLPNSGNTITITGNVNINGKGIPLYLVGHSNNNCALSKASGTVNMDYVWIGNLNATGGATWKTGPHSFEKPWNGTFGTGWTTSVKDDPGAIGASF